MIKITILSMLALSSVLALFAIGYAQSYDTLWTKTIGGIYSDGGADVIESHDGNYIITGSTSSYGAGHQDLYLIKTDSNGDTIWTRTFGGGGTEFGRSLAEAENGDIMVFGVTYSFGDYIDYYLVKVDSMGDSIWSRTYGGPALDNGYSIAHADSGFVLLGFSESYGAGENDIYLIKVNNDGDTIWTKTYGGVYDDQGFSIQQTSDGGFIITGYTESFGSGLQDVFLVKTDPMGDTLWTRTFGGSNNDFGWFVNQTTDDGYMVVGITDSLGTGDYNIYIIKTDSVGNLLWTRSYGEGGFDFGSSLCETEEGDYLIAGTLNQYTSDSSDACLIKVNYDGDSLWAMAFGGLGNEGAASIERTSDNNFIITGYTSSQGAGATDVYLLKLAPGQSDIKYIEYERRIFIGFNYPNPFNARTTISYSLPQQSEITIAVYSLLGRKIAILYSGVQQAGEHSIMWDASDIPSGIYFARLQSGDHAENIKMVLLK